MKMVIIRRENIEYDPSTKFDKPDFKCVWAVYDDKRMTASMDKNDFIIAIVKKDFISYDDFAYNLFWRTVVNMIKEYKDENK